MDVLRELREELATYLTGSSGKCANLIKFDVNSGEFDILFAKKFDIWRNYLKINDATSAKDNILLYKYGNEDIDEKQAIERFMTESGRFRLPILRMETDLKCCYISFARDKTFKMMIKRINDTDFRCTKDDEALLSIDIAGIHSSSITEYRVETIKRTVINLMSYTPHIYVSDSSIAKHKILLTTKSNFKKDEEVSHSRMIVCGIVSCNKGEEDDINAYLKKRTTDMYLTAIHKHGIRAKDDKKFLELIERLGRAATTLDMIEVKHSNLLKLNSNPKQAFILYNSARLETLLRTFDERVKANYYHALPDIENVDFGLLADKEEWELMKLLLSFHEVIEKTIGELIVGKLALHHLYKYLLSIVNCFSVFYARVKILTENRPQLIPVLHAKIYLLKAVQSIFNQILKVLDIEPVSFM